MGESEDPKLLTVVTQSELDGYAVVSFNVELFMTKKLTA
jgi:hypothetical protein